MQEEPSDHCYVVLQDHGEDGGGWGPAALHVLGVTGPFVYTGSDERTVAALEQIAVKLAEATGKPTVLAKFTQRKDVLQVNHYPSTSREVADAV